MANFRALIILTLIGLAALYFFRAGPGSHGVQIIERGKNDGPEETLDFSKNTGAENVQLAKPVQNISTAESPVASMKEKGQTVASNSVYQPDYVEAFSGLETKSWYYRAQDPATKDRIQKKVLRERLTPFDSRLTRLIDLKEGERFSCIENRNYDELRKAFADKSIEEVTYHKGNRLSHMPSERTFDVPYCTVHFNREKADTYLSTERGYPLDPPEQYTFDRETKGVRVNMKRDDSGEIGFWIRSVDCAVREANPASDSFRKLAIIHLVATLGIDCDI